MNSLLILIILIFVIGSILLLVLINILFRRKKLKRTDLISNEALDQLIIFQDLVSKNLMN